MTTRVCKSCGEDKPLSAFNKSKRTSGQCKKCFAAYMREYRAKTPGWKKKKRAWDLKRNYGMTTEDYDSLYKAQNGRCAICECKCQLVVDHDHNTGDVRGLLCSTCNVGLGMLKEDPQIATSLVRYLEAYE